MNYIEIVNGKELKNVLNLPKLQPIDTKALTRIIGQMNFETKRLNPILIKQREIQNVISSVLSEFTRISNSNFIGLGKIFEEFKKPLIEFKEINSMYNMLQLPLKEMQDTINKTNSLLIDRLNSIYDVYDFNELIKEVVKNPLNSINWSNIGKLCNVAKDIDLQKIENTDIEDINQYITMERIESKEELISLVNNIVEDAIKKDKDGVLLNPYLTAYIFPFILSLFFYICPQITEPPSLENANKKATNSALGKEVISSTSNKKVEIRAIKNKEAEIIGYIPEKYSYNTVVVTDEWLYIECSIGGEKLEGWMNQEDLIE